METIELEAWGGEGSNDVSVIIAAGNDFVINGCWWAERSQDCKNIKPCKKHFKWEDYKNTRFLGYFNVNPRNEDGSECDYNDLIFQIEKQIENNPELISKDGICKKIKKSKKRVIIKEKDEEPPF